MPDQRCVDECMVCLDHTSSRIGPCGHCMYQECAARWLKDTATCPYCRQDTFGLTDWSPPPSTPTVHVALPADSHAGIRVSNHPRGVHVDHVHPLDRCAQSSIRRGTLLEALNGIPCVRHEVVVRMFDAARSHGAVVAVHSPERRLPLLRRMRRFALRGGAR